MKLKVVNTQGAETGKEIEISDDIFAVEPNDHAIYLDVKQFMANRRQGNHQTKQRHELSGSTKKLRRQKGTGAARIGSIKSGVLRGGYRIHGPRSKDYSFKLNKKVKRLARISALSYKAKDNKIVVVDTLEMEKPNTKGFNQILGNLNVAGDRSLIVTADYDKNVYLSGRNLPNSEILEASKINTYQVLKAKSLVLTADAVNKLQEALKA